MRKKTLRRMLAVIEGSAYEPNESHRRTVVTLKLNDVPHDRIAACIGISRVCLEYFYAQELDLAVDQVCAFATERMLFLASQNADLGVALRANQAILNPRVKSWREAHVDPTSSIGDISDLTLEQCEQAIERLERLKRTATEAEEAAARADPDEAEFA
ncbi:MAG: hypothetical protein ABW003_16640 [Microvirga sp.]